MDSRNYGGQINGDLYHGDVRGEINNNGIGGCRTSGESLGLIGLTFDPRNMETFGFEDFEVDSYLDNDDAGAGRHPSQSYGWEGYESEQGELKLNDADVDVAVGRKLQANSKPQRSNAGRLAKNDADIHSVESRSVKSTRSLHSTGALLNDKAPRPKKALTAQHMTTAERLAQYKNTTLSKETSHRSLDLAGAPQPESTPVISDSEDDSHWFRNDSCAQKNRLGMECNNAFRSGPSESPTSYGDYRTGVSGFIPRNSLEKSCKHDLSKDVTRSFGSGNGLHNIIPSNLKAPPSPSNDYIPSKLKSPPPPSNEYIPSKFKRPPPPSNQNIPSNLKPPPPPPNAEAQHDKGSALEVMNRNQPPHHLNSRDFPAAYSQTHSENSSQNPVKVENKNAFSSSRTQLKPPPPSQTAPPHQNIHMLHSVVHKDESAKRSPLRTWPRETIPAQTARLPLEMGYSNDLPGSLQGRASSDFHNSTSMELKQEISSAPVQRTRREHRLHQNNFSKPSGSLAESQKQAFEDALKKLHSKSKHRRTKVENTMPSHSGGGHRHIIPQGYTNGVHQRSLRNAQNPQSRQTPLHPREKMFAELHVDERTDKTKQLTHRCEGKPSGMGAASPSSSPLQAEVPPPRSRKWKKKGIATASADSRPLYTAGRTPSQFSPHDFPYQMNAMNFPGTNEIPHEVVPEERRHKRRTSMGVLGSLFCGMGKQKG